MKKAIIIIIITSLTCGIAAARDKNNLPDVANFFISHVFPERTIIMMDGGRDYDVLLDDGTEITFDKHGDWEDIDASKSVYGIPLTILPNAIAKVVNLKFPGEKIINMEHDTDDNEFSVEMEKGGELKYNSAGTIIDIDLQ